MLRGQKELHGRLQMVADGALFALAWWLAYLVRTRWRVPWLGENAEIFPFAEYRWLWLVVLPAGPWFLNLSGFYDRSLIVSRGSIAWQAFRAALWAAGTVVLASWVFRQGHVIARSVVPYFAVIAFALVMVKEEVLLRWRRTNWRLERSQRRLILLGAPEETERLKRELAGHSNGDLVVAAELDIDRADVDQLIRLMHEHAINGVLLSGGRLHFNAMEQAIAACEREGVEVWLVVDFFKTNISRARVDELFGRPVLVFSSGPDKSWPALAKRAIDVVGSAVLLAMGAIPMLGVLIAIRLTSPGPALFRQKRAGLNGRPFTMLKFRSMISDAEQRKQELAALNEMSGPVFKVSNDPRITPLGRFLRKFSVDEFPQLVNVWRGEMSLVGPRPLPVDEVSRFDDLSHRRRLSVKPGLTCLWQVSGRNHVTDFNEWVRLDLEYIDNWSLWLDLQILARTVPVVLVGSGAK